MAHKLAAFSLRKALFTALNGTITYGGAAVPIYDDMAPQGTTGRWIVLGYCTDADDSTKNSDGREVVVALGIWSAYQGTKEVNTIADSITALFAATPLAVTGWRVALVGRGPEWYEVTIEDTEEPVYRHGILRYRFRLYQTG